MARNSFLYDLAEALPRRIFLSSGGREFEYLDLQSFGLGVWTFVLLIYHSTSLRISHPHPALLTSLLHDEMPYLAHLFSVCCYSFTRWRYGLSQNSTLESCWLYKSCKRTRQVRGGKPNSTYKHNGPILLSHPANPNFLIPSCHPYQATTPTPKTTNSASPATRPKTGDPSRPLSRPPLARPHQQQSP